MKTFLPIADKSFAQKTARGLIGAGSGFLIGCVLAAITLGHGKLTVTGRQLAVIGTVEVVVGVALYFILSMQKSESKGVKNGKK